MFVLHSVRSAEAGPAFEVLVRAGPGFGDRPAVDAGQPLPVGAVAAEPAARPRVELRTQPAVDAREVEVDEVAAAAGADDGEGRDLRAHPPSPTPPPARP